MKCFTCGKELESSVNVIFGNRVMCDNCYANNDDFLKCDYCEKEYPSECGDEIYDEDTDDYRPCCPDCYKEYKYKYPHNYKPCPMFHHEDNENRHDHLHIGAELEIQAENEGYCVDFINEFEKTIKEDCFYLKEDGSLYEDLGVEIVSHPMTLKNAIGYWKSIFDLMNKHKMNDIRGCGLHFHLDKIGLNDRAIRNLDFIVNNFTNSIYNIGKRNVLHSEWASSVNKELSEWGHETSKDMKYRALHFCKNTIELRCFNSTDSWSEFVYRLVCVFALVKMAKIHHFEYFYNMNDNRFWETFDRFQKRFYKIA